MAIFSFDIEPLAQARPRIAPRPYPHIYDPNNVKKYKEELHSLAVQKMKESGLKPFDGALFIKISFYRPIQKSVSKKEHARRSIGHVLPVKKPDLDNLPIDSISLVFNFVVTLLAFCNHFVGVLSSKCWRKVSKMQSLCQR